MIQLVSSRPYLLPLFPSFLVHFHTQASCFLALNQRAIGECKHIARKKVVAALEHLHVETDIQMKRR